MRGDPGQTGARYVVGRAPLARPVGASRAMPLNSLYAVWAIVFSIVLTGLHPTVQLVTGVLITFGGAVLVVASAPRSGGDLDENEAIFPPAAR